LQVSEKFGCRSSEIFRKKTEFSNSQNFHEKVWKKVWKFKFGKKFRNYSKMYVNVVGLDGNPAIWQHSIVEMLACAWLLCCDSEANKLDI